MASLGIGLIEAGGMVPARLRGDASLRATGVDDFLVTAGCPHGPARARLLLDAGEVDAYQRDLDEQYGLHG